MTNFDQTSPRKKILNSLQSADSSAGDEFDRLAISGLQRRRNIQKDLRELDGRVSARWHRNLGIRISRTASLVFAMLALLLVTWWLMPVTAPTTEVALQQLEERLVQPLSTTPLGTVRNATLTEEGSQLLADGLKSYEEGDFAAAAMKFEQYWQQHPEAKEVRLYLGHSLLLTQPLQAEGVLRSLAADEDVEWAITDKASYLLAWVYLRTDRQASAVGLLDSLHSVSGKLPSEAAQLFAIINKKKL